MEASTNIKKEEAHPSFLIPNKTSLSGSFFALYFALGKGT